MTKIFRTLTGALQPEVIVLALNACENTQPQPTTRPEEAPSVSLTRADPGESDSNRRLNVIPIPSTELHRNGTLGASGHGPAKEHPLEPAPADKFDEWAVTSPRIRTVHLAAVCPVLSNAERHAYAAEQYRIVRTKTVQLLRKPFRAVITSPSIGDGKTLTVVNLAAALALRTEERTLLIDADLRRAGVHRVLQVPLKPGLADVLAGRCRLDEALFVAEELPGLYVLPAGQPDGNPTELLASPRWQALAEAVRRQFAHVIVDSPPVEIVADYDLIAAVCEGVVLVIRPDHTNRTLALAAIEKLRPKLTGVVINATPEWFLWKKPANHGYYYYRPDAKKGRHAENCQSE